MEKSIIEEALKVMARESLDNNNPHDEEAKLKELKERRLRNRYIANALKNMEPPTDKEKSEEDGNADKNNDSSGDKEETYGSLMIKDFFEQAKLYQKVSLENKQICPVNALNNTQIETRYNGRVACFSFSSSKNANGDEVVSIHNKKFLGNHQKKLSEEQTKCAENGEQLIDVMQKIMWKFTESS